MVNRLLAFDPSMTAFGWCLAYGPPTMPSAWEHGTLRCETLEELSLKLGQMMADLKPDLMVYEDPIQQIFLYGKKQLVHLPQGGMMFTPNAAQIILWKIEGALRAIGSLCACPMLAVAPRTWRASILGDGNMPKDKAKQRAKVTCDRVGIPIRSVDEAEACCVALYGLGSTEFRMAAMRDVHGWNHKVDEVATIQ